MGNHMNKHIAALTVACLAATSANAAGLPERIKSAGKVVVANQPNYPPMEYVDPATNELRVSTSISALRLPRSSAPRSNGRISASNR